METVVEEAQLVYNEGIGTPTTGFVAYLYMTKCYPSKEIILVGFTGHYADGSIPDKLHHSYDWEQAYYKNNDVKRFYSTTESLTSNIPTAY